MFTKVCVLLLAIGLSQAAVQIPDAGLVKFMMNTRDISQSHPQRNVECLGLYLPQLSEEIEKLQAGFDQCEKQSADERESIDATTDGDRKKIDASATDSCKALDTCSQLTSAQAYFDCYSSAGGNNTMVMYEISADAASVSRKIQEDYRLIQINEYECTNKTNRIYVENTANIYTNMDRCVAGLEPLPNPNDSTPAPPESTPAPPDSTPAPAESTPAPAESTPAPAESTPAPGESTPAPAESTPAPAESTPAPGESTQAPAESTPADSKELPEEDLSRIVAEQNKFKNVMEEMKKWFKRH